MKLITNHIFALLSLAVLYSCADKDITLNEFAANPIKFKRQEISLDTGDFTVAVPKNWSWRNENEDCDGENILLMLNIGSPSDKDGYIDIISIQKIKSQSNSNDLLTEYNFLNELSKKRLQGFKRVETGETSLLHYPAYFFHSKSNTGSYGEIENISFVLKSNENGYFYHLIANASQTNNLEQKMSMMILSLMTFKMRGVNRS